MATIPLLLAEQDVENGGKEENPPTASAVGGIQNDFAYNNNVSNANIKIRMGFLRKVYGLLSIQLLITVVVGTVFVTSDAVKLFVQQNNWSILVSFVLTIVTLIALHVKRRDHPTNLILLAAFTLVQSYTVGIIVSMYETAVVIQALFITLSIVFGLTVFTFQTKRDFSFLGFGLFAGLCALLVGGFLQIFLHSTALELFIGIAGAILFSLFIIFDTQQIMHNLSPEEYILATINIYLDIINLFMYILRILAASSRQ